MIQRLEKNDTFAADVLAGLSSIPKKLSSKYFYDDEGSRLFMEIMKLPEYYLTRSEIEIFSQQTAEIFNAFSDGVDSFDLIELGAGDGTKTAILIDYFLQQNVDITYAPIDISKEACDILTAKFNAEFPALKMDAQHGDYFNVLENFRQKNSRRKILLFLGSNIGNFNHEQSLEFFGKLRGVMNPNDFLFTGFDLQKDPRVIREAYDDSAGVTAKFNLNLLTRMNRELGADFAIEKFSHYATYHPTENAARSFLISREKQSVHIESLGRTFDFEQWEALFMEISQKYSPEMIVNMASSTSFEVVTNFHDAKHYYCDSLWLPI